MKKKILILVVFLFSLFVLVGCAEGAVGPQGEQGIQGIQGIQGPKGDKGDPGEAGQDGLDGMDGVDGVNGVNGVDGVDAKEIELFAEDGGVYWRYVGESKSNLLYYYKDTITLTYAKRLYNSEAEIVADFLSDMETALNAPAKYTYDGVKAATVAARANLVAAQALEADAVSAALVAYKAADKSDDEKALAAKVAYLTAVKAEFLADLTEAYGSEITAANIWTTFKQDDADKQLLGTDGTKGVGLFAQNPNLLLKWGWVFEYLGNVLKNDGSDSSHKYEYAALRDNGLATPEGVSFASGSWKYCNRYILGALHNFLNSTNDQKGDSSSYPQPDFSTLEKYDIAAITAAHEAGIAAVAANTTDAAEAVTTAVAAEAAAKTAYEEACIKLAADFSDAYDNLYKYLFNDKAKTMDQMVTDKHASGILYNGEITELGAKWKWLLAWLVEAYKAGHEGSIDDNKYVSTGYALLDPTYEGRSDATGDYRDRLVMSALHNYIYHLRKADNTEKTYDNVSGSGSENYWNNFFPADATAYRSLEDYAKEEAYVVLKSLEIDRVGENSWKKYELITMEDPLVVAAYDADKCIVQGWVNSSDETIEAIPDNHSIVLFLDIAKKVTVNLEFNGGYYLNDVAPYMKVDQDRLLELYANFRNVDASELKFDNYSCSGNLDFAAFVVAKLAEEPDMVEFFKEAVKNGDMGSSIKGGLFDLSEGGDAKADDTKYGNYYVVGSFIANKQIRSDSSSWKGLNPSDTAVLAAYYKHILSKKLAAGTVDAMPQTLNNVIVANGLPVINKDGEAFVCWSLKGDDTHTPVAAAEMEDGKTYVANYLDPETAARAKALTDAFLADVSTALGKTYTADSLYSEFRPGDPDNPDTSYFMGVKAEGDVLVKAGVMVGHEDVIQKHAFIFEYIGQLLMDEKWIGSSKHKYENTVLSLFGITVPEGARIVTAGSEAKKYFNRCLVVQLVNLINHTYVATGEEGYDAIDFSDPNLWCYGLLEYKAAYDAAHPAQ